MADKDLVTIYEDWEEVGGTVFYKWREKDSDEWNYRKTPYTQKPVVHFRYMTQEEFGYFKQDPDMIKDWTDIR